MRYMTTFLTLAADRLEIDLTPNTKRQLGEQSAPIALQFGQSTTPDRPAASVHATPTQPKSPFEAVLAKYNPEGKEPTDSPLR
jgi:hypothetical protein